MLFVRLSIFYFFYFALLGVMAPYLGLYLANEDYSLLEIAGLVSLLMLTKILAPNLWGAIADRSQKRLALIRAGSAATLVCYLGFFIADSFWSYALVIFCFSFFWNAVLPQFEVITLFNLGERREQYSLVRLWGSIGFIGSVVIAGWIFDRFGVEYFPWVLLLVISCIWLSSLYPFKEPVAEASRGQELGFKDQLLQRPVLIFFAVSCLLQMSHGAYYTYFSIFLETLSYNKTSIGMLWSLGVLAEVLLFVVMRHWFSKHNVRQIMVIALMLTGLRWVLIAEFAAILPLLLIAQVLHAMSFGAMHAASIHYVHQVFAHHNQGRAQALYSSVGFGLGGAIGAFLSGLFVSEYSYSVAFWLSAVVAFAAAAMMAAQGLEKNQL